MAEPLIPEENRTVFGTVPLPLSGARQAFDG